ncbi:Armadillo-like helical [Artemisia annua]|uniref:Armadillo-like helical n=1 Tax=Artemisia annua TaxID=35608 RepID=A0A2U1LZD3_ARTAN|nr:Armadillo-like helical [Artemisia annua]
MEKVNNINEGRYRLESDSPKPTIKPLSDYILKHGLLKQKDKDARLLVAICVCEILRILAPEPGFSDEDFRDIFQLLLGMFAELADTKSRYYSRKVELLETIAKYNFCVRMLDIRGEDLFMKMFNIFFSVIRPCLDENEAFLTTTDSAVNLLPKATKPVVGWKGVEYKAAIPILKPPGASFYPPEMDKMVLIIIILQVLVNSYNLYTCSYFSKRKQISCPKILGSPLIAVNKSDANRRHTPSNCLVHQFYKCFDKP